MHGSKLPRYAPLAMLLACACALLSAVARCAAQQTSAPDLTNEQKLALFGKMRRCTVKVYARIKDDLYHVGTGVAIQRFDDDVLVVTNAHVVEAEEGPGLSPEVTLGLWSTDARLSAKILLDVRSEEKKLDVALLIAHDPARRLQIADMAKGLPDLLEKGTPVFACGHPRGESFLCTTGTIKAFHHRLEENAGLPTIEHDALIEHGSSGGGLFDGEGKLLGINTWMLDKRIGVAVPVAYFVENLQVYEKWVAADADWQDLGVDVTPHGLVRVMASGRWTIDGDGETADSRGIRETPAPRADERYPYAALLVRFGDTVERVGNGLKRTDGSAELTYPDTFFGLIGEGHGRVALRINIRDNAACSGRLHVFVLVYPTLE